MDIVTITLIVLLSIAIDKYFITNLNSKITKMLQDSETFIQTTRNWTEMDYKTAKKELNSSLRMRIINLITIFIMIGAIFGVFNAQIILSVVKWLYIAKLVLMFVFIIITMFVNKEIIDNYTSKFGTDYLYSIIHKGFAIDAVYTIILLSMITNALSTFAK